MRITFIGGGNMASAMIGGLIADGLDAAAITVVDPQAEARERIATRFGIRAFATAQDGETECDLLVLAVKPQQLREVAEAVSPLSGRPTVLTIAAGIRVTDLSRWLSGYPAIVRAMPNTPALVGAGVTGAWAAASVEPARRAAAERILAAMGTVIWVHDEGMLDAVTALSGSGPAYVFYFLESLIRAGRTLGFEPAVARSLAYGTVFGTMRLAAASDDTPEVLRARVTSKGGTTERALAVMEERAVGDGVVAAVVAARDRARELGEILGEA